MGSRIDATSTPVAEEHPRFAGAARYHHGWPPPPAHPVPTTTGESPRVKLQESDAKSLLVAQGLPVPDYEVARTPHEARAAAERSLAAGADKVVDQGAGPRRRPRQGRRRQARRLRGRGGAGRRARSSGMDIKGTTVRKVLVAAAADIVKEYYLAAVLDRAGRGILLMGSAEGGVEIEEVAEEHPDAIAAPRPPDAGPARPPGPKARLLDGPRRATGRRPPRSRRGSSRR